VGDETSAAIDLIDARLDRIQQQLVDLMTYDSHI
jgi:hypothetical protein